LAEKAANNKKITHSKTA